MSYKILLLLILFNKNYFSIFCDHVATQLLSNNCSNSFSNFNTELISNNNSGIIIPQNYKTCSLHFDTSSNDNIILIINLNKILCNDNNFNSDNSFAIINSIVATKFTYVDNFSGNFYVNYL